MPKTPTPPPFPPVVAHLTVHDCDAAIAFYKKAFGAVELLRHAAPDGKKIMHATFTVLGHPVMINDDFPEYTGKPQTPRALGGSPVTLHLSVPDVDAAWQKAVKAGAEVTMPLADQFWGDRYGKLRDPFGHEWSLSANKNKKLSDAEIRKGAEKAFGKPRATPAAKAAKRGR